MKYRIKFTKEDLVKFVPHLDLLRLYQRAIRRADLPIAYSNGFNPHQQMSFAQPLSVGWTSICEYMDIETTCIVDIDNFINSINECLPDGTKVIDMRKLEDGEKNSMASVEAALYYITLDNLNFNLYNLMEKFLNKGELIIEKKSKHLLKQVDIKQDIFKLEIIGNDMLSAFIAAGSNRNLKPDLLVKCFYMYNDMVLNPYKIKYERQDLFKKKGENFVSLFSS